MDLFDFRKAFPLNLKLRTTPATLSYTQKPHEK
jgi:hypothetical protein